MGVVLAFSEGFGGLEEVRQSGVGKPPMDATGGVPLFCPRVVPHAGHQFQFDGVEEGVYFMRCGRQAVLCCVSNHTKRNRPRPPNLQAQGVFPV